MRGFGFDVARRVAQRWLPAMCVTLLLAVPGAVEAQHDIQIVTDADGQRLVVDGETVMVKGVNWDYFPIGTTTTYSLWTQPASFIQQALDREMALLRAMGGNAIRVYNGIPARWIEYIYDTYGVWSIVNHPVGRYGVTLGGTYIPATDYSNETQRQLIIDEVVSMVEEQDGTRGLLMWLLGNENNYGLEWSSAETEDLPAGEQFAVKARYLYSLVGEVTAAIKEIDTARPVALANGDLQYLDIIAEEASNLDVFGSNVYRGDSFRDFFQRVQDEMGIPVMFTEFGADAFNARTMEEDQVTQARYLIEQWREIFEQSAGKGLVGNSIGGLTFQWTDGWWKFGQTERLDIQDTNASWANDAYPEDYVEGNNNMNEEWWGIIAKGPTDAQGFYGLYPRAAYYALQQAYELDPYGQGVDIASIRAHFSDISPVGTELMARADRATLLGQRTSLARFSGMRMEFETYSTGGDGISTPDEAGRPTDQSPGFQGFDTKQSFYASFQANPASNIQADLTVNLLGAVP
ncbi:MAG: glycosidase, partial [Gemmatimonadetes bacterium]|nr:glycosidase [Gemmatimonadota bacterium]